MAELAILKITVEAKDDNGVNIKLTKQILIPDSTQRTNPLAKDANKQIAEAIKTMINPLLESWYADTKL